MVWLAGFFNPQSFLTAIMQSTARKNEWPLDKMCLHCDVTKKSREEFTYVSFPFKYYVITYHYLMSYVINYLFVNLLTKGIYGRKKKTGKLQSPTKLIRTI